MQVLYVGLGGFVGAGLRYLISVSVPKLLGTQLPYGTLFVNVIGGLLIGFIMEFSMATDFISPNLRLFLATGMMGGLTTFSTFSYETISLFSDGSYMLGTLNTCLNLILSFLGVIIGRFLVSQII